MPVDPLLEDVETMSDEEAREVLREIQVLETERLENEQYKYYEPNGKCEEFIKIIGLGQTFITFFSAANGVGKTAAGANVIAHFAFESDNSYFNYPLFKNFKFPKAGRIVTDPTNAKGVVRTLKEWLPKGQYTAKKGRKDYDSVWNTKSGFEWDIMTYEQDPKEFEGPTLGWIWFDEPPPEAIFKACVARLRKGGLIFITATPLTGSAWLYDHIIANPDQELADKGQRAYVEADVEAACKQHGVRGHLEHEHIQKIIAEYSEDDKQARIHGKFQHLTGIVFKRFNRNIHVIKPFAITHKDFTVYHALDTHPRTNDAGLWVAVDRQGTKFVVDELWIQVNSDEELASQLKSKMSLYRVERKLLEPAAFIKDQHSEKSLASKLDGHDLVYLEASKTRDASDRRIEDAINYIQVNEYMVKAPEIYIFETCRRTIYEMEHWRWDEWNSSSADKHGQKEKKIDKDDHMIENLGRILIQEPVFVPVEKKNSSVDKTGGRGYDPYA